MNITSIVEALVLAGANPEQILAAVRAAEAPMIEKATLKREADRQRKIRQRDNQNQYISIDESRGQSVTECDTPSQGFNGFPHPSLLPNSPPSKINPIGFTKGSPKVPKRGTRITEDWHLPDEWGEWAETMGLPPPEIVAQARKFHDYWLSKSGKDATKVSWQATWRNWIRNYLENYRK